VSTRLERYCSRPRSASAAFAPVVSRRWRSADRGWPGAGSTPPPPRPRMWQPRRCPSTTRARTV